MLAPIENVAVLALVYRTIWRNRYSAAVCLREDMDGYPDGLSLLGMIGSQALTALDWDLLALMERADFPRLQSRVTSPRSTPGRSEALLHAWS